MMTWKDFVVRRYQDACTKFPNHIAQVHIYYYEHLRGGDIMEDLLKAIANVGFPIAVAAYLLIRIESKMDNLSSSINQLSTILSIKLSGSDDHKAA
jgi:hypothetical protein